MNFRNSPIATDAGSAILLICENKRAAACSAAYNVNAPYMAEIVPHGSSA